VHWADRLAENLIKEVPDLSTYTFASGITPSGAVHVGNLRDIVTNWFVARALKDRGKNVRLVHSWDDYDRFRKIPKDVPAHYAEFLGKPISKVPDPKDEFPSYAARFERAFERSLADLGIDFEFRYQSMLYESGAYSPGIVKAVLSRTQIFDIISSYRSQESSLDERSAYLPIEIYCRVCDKDTTSIQRVDFDNLTVSYRCKSCGAEETIDLRKATNVKLPWKIDWPMRWAYEHVNFEPGGKDHATKGGSFWVASDIARQVYGITPPIFQPYEFVGLKGLVGKMSSSSGDLLTPAQTLQVYQPEVLLWIFARVHPTKAFNLVVDKQLFQVYDEFDRAFENSKKDVSSADARSLALSTICGRTVVPVSFRQLASFTNIVKGNRRALLDVFERLGSHYQESDICERAEKAEAWLRDFAPEEKIDLLVAPNQTFYASLSQIERDWITALSAYLSSGPHTLSEISTDLYAIPQLENVTSPDTQKRFFRIIYRLLFDRDQGPRLGTFFSALTPDRYLHLLSFRG
jgi:lysyl-tRNA synthetase class 1